MTTTWAPQQPLDGRANPCLCCPPIPAELPPDAVIAVGFGDAHVSRDGVEVYREPSAYHGEKRCTADGCRGGRVGEPNAPKPRILKRQSKKNKAIAAAYWKAVYELPVCGVCGGDGMVPDPDAPEAVYWTVADAEEVAAADPDHDWQIVMFGPLHGEVYQRQDGRWLLIEKNQGFA